MDTSQPDDDQPIQEALRRRDQAIVEEGSVKFAVTRSWGEHLLPFLFAALEACWIDAILVGLASFVSPDLSNMLVPPWVPFLLLMGCSWLLSFLERRELEIAPGDATIEGARPPAITGSSLFYMAVTAAILVAIWASIYSSEAWLINPLWLGFLLNDILLLSARAYHVLGVVLLSIFLCWWGMRNSRRELEPGGIYNTLRLGMGIILAVIILRAGTMAGTPVGLAMLLLLLIFLALALVAHSLARAVFMRKSHPSGLQGSIALQERSVLWVVSSVGVLLLLIGSIVGFLTSPAFLAQVRQALSPLGTLYDLLVNAAAQLAVWLVTPLFWLIDRMHLKTSLPTPPPPPVLCRAAVHCVISPPATPPPAVVAAASFLKVFIPILIVALIVFLIWLALRRRRAMLTRIERRFDESHESLWSWALFWQQVRGLLLAFWRRFFPPSATVADPEAMEEIEGEPAARSIREIYRALLKWAAGQGYARKKDETPNEFKVRLDEHLPQVEPELDLVTQAYTAIRYGGIIPADEDVARVQREWQILQQKTQKS